ncbi:MAG: DUF3352 domain-containing protein [Lewinellaceae bacterium]|nr:DUF3352 domain-containing protein [Saprospiraceae bacterium]MCB9330449.1 DUF3352 domain-containing protein [Lewinellaceae bacterium]
MLIVLFSWVIWLRRPYHILEAVPSQTALVLTAQNPGAFKSDADLPDWVTQLMVIQILRRDISLAEQVFQQKKLPLVESEAPALAAAFSLQAVDSLHPLLLVDLGQEIDLDKLIADFDPANNISVSKFKGHAVCSVQFSDSRRLVLATQRNLLLLSRFSYLVEDALIQLDDRDTWWLKNARFPEANLQVSLRPSVLAERSSSIFKSVWHDLPSRLSAPFNCLTIYRHGQKWNLSGTLNQPLAGLANDRWNSEGLSAILPDNTALALWATFKDNSTFGQYFSNEGPATDFQKYILPWAGNEFAYVVGEPFSPDLKDDQFLVFSVRDVGLANRYLDAYGAQTGALKKYDYQTYEIRQFLSQSILGPLVGTQQEKFANPVCAQIHNYMVFAASPSALELVIDKYIVSQTLNNAPDFLLLNQQLAGKGNGFCYFNAAYLPQLIRQFFHPEWITENQHDLTNLAASGMHALDIGFKNDNLFVSDIATVVPSKTPTHVGILWKTPLAADAITAPFFVADAAEENAPAILIQDNQLQLYRLNTNGNILWRKQLDWPIQSAILGIDYYKNGRNCYLFNTADAIWILDDEGQPLTGYPLRLQSPAINGLTLIDFDGDQNYAFFIACQNGNLYGFDQFGRPLPGWNPKSGAGRIKHPLIHFKHGTKDYLAVLSLSGQLSVFNRNGTEHFASLQFEGNFSITPPQFDAESETPRIVCTSASGRAYVCNLTGKTFVLNLGTGKEANSSCMVLEQIFGDPRKDYATLFGDQLIIEGYEDQHFEQKNILKLPVPADTLFYSGCCGKLGAINLEKRQLYLIDGEKGTIYPGFPLAGTTPFCLSLIPDGTRQLFLLIAGNRNTVCAYKIE